MSMTIEQIQALYDGFPNQFESVVLATVDAKGVPNASYAPYVMDADKTIYVYISTISQQTQNIASTLKASVMYIENEAEAKQIFARKRLTYECEASLVEAGSEKCESIVALFSQKFGAVINAFKKMSDFKVYALKPVSGRFVIGFGMAYDITAPDLNKLLHVNGGGHGHSGHAQGGHGHVHGGHAHGAHGHGDHAHGGHGHGAHGHAHHAAVEGEALTAQNKSGIIEHMNNGHPESVLNISRFFGGYKEATKAVLLDIEQTNLKVQITVDSKESEILIKLPSEINTTADAHHTLVKLSKESREKLTAGV